MVCFIYSGYVCPVIFSISKAKCSSDGLKADIISTPTSLQILSPVKAFTQIVSIVSVAIIILHPKIFATSISCAIALFFWAWVLNSLGCLNSMTAITSLLLIIIPSTFFNSNEP